MNGHGDGDGVGAGTGTGVEMNDGAQDGNGDGSGDGAGMGTGTGTGVGAGTEARTIAEMGTGKRITESGTKIGLWRAEERRRSAKKRKIVVDAMWETGETWVKRGKKM